ncbi:MAG: hypothetical protein PF489_09525 [Salinivirgaceae bacterium]|nr:hypothetical protein [Salinivirgaceae bacterium]
MQLHKKAFTRDQAEWLATEILNEGNQKLYDSKVCVSINLCTTTNLAIHYFARNKTPITEL